MACEVWKVSIQVGCDVSLSFFYWHLFEMIELLVLEGLQVGDEIWVWSTGNEELDTH